jgi:hypothetical protein
VLLAAVTFPPVQLGFGFALVGIGGLVGLNRTVDVAALQQGARAGHLDDVMFPADLAHNAARVAADLGRYFPPKDGQYLVGLAVQLVWGSAGLLTADIAVIIEFPSPLRVALLGSMRITLPKPSAPVVDITLDVLGVFDPAAKTLSIDAGLRDSKIAGFTLTGQAAIRARWDANASFVVAVGGFHPHFKAPAAFPPLRRVTLALGGANPRLTLSTYMALTSNTVQFGATAELYVTAGPAAVRGHLSFDAVVQPFTVRIDLSIKVEVLLGGYPLLALGLDLHLSGPSPWHIGGRAHFHVLFLSFTVPINLTIGSAAPLLPPVPVDVVAVVVAALTERHNWHYGPPPGPPVATIGPGVTPDACVHPLGTIAVRQSVAPLGTKIDRLGADILRRPTTVNIDRSKVTVNGRPVAAVTVTDYFAPAQFMTLGDAAKLSAPSFETMAAGALFGPAGFSVPQHDTAAVVTPSPKQWTTLIVEPSDTAPAAGATRPARPVAADPSGPSDQLLAAQLPGAAATVNGAASQGPAPYRARPCGKSVAAPTYAAVNMALAPQDPTTTRAETFATLSSAAPAHQPVQVIFTSEIPGAAPPLSAWRI